MNLTQNMNETDVVENINIPNRYEYEYTLRTDVTAVINISYRYHRICPRISVIENRKYMEIFQASRLFK